MFVGILFLIKETTKFDMVVTKTTATHITTVVDKLTVTANAEQIPRTCKAMGLLLNTGSNNTSFCVVITCNFLDYRWAILFELRNLSIKTPNPSSPVQKLTRFSTPRVVKVAPESASIS